MNNSEIVKKDLLRRKINEYFSKNPKATSVIIKADVGGPSKTVWKVERTKTKYNITEVNTLAEKYKFEAPIGGQAPAIPPADAPVPQGQQQAKQTNVAQFNQLDLPTRLAQLATGMMLNYDTVISTLAMIVKDKSKDLVQLRRALESGINTASVDANQKRLLGNIMGILTSISNERGLMASKEVKGKGRLNESPKKKLKEESETQEEPPNETSPEEIEAQDQAELELEPIAKNKSDEELLLISSLKGHAIKEADIDLNPNGGVLTLGLVGISNPVEIAWHNSGKVIFTFKGRPYTLKK